MVCAILVKSIKETLVGIYFEFGPVVQEAESFLSFYLFLALVAILLIRAEPFV